MNFNELGINKNILKAISHLGFVEPTPIQEKSIPILLSGERDYIGLAQTGTGKTAAFGLPILHAVDVQKRIAQVLILCPTRELCLQISNELKSYAKYVDDLTIAPIYGGVDIKKQIVILKKGVHVIVGTPGRLLDHLKRRTINLDTVKIVVLDEADEMLNMGFQQDIDSILQQTPNSKRTWLFSATMPDKVGLIAKNYMVNPFKVTVGSKNSSGKNIEHYYCLVQRYDRYEALKRFIAYYSDLFGIVFCRTKRETKDLAQKLINDNYNVDVLHGDLSQFQRDIVMKKFRNRQVQLLIATDVAARGIDVNDVTHVIHYSLSDDVEGYTHRSGRTARAGKFGMSLAILDIKEARRIKYIERQIGKEINRKLVPQKSIIVERYLANFAKKINEAKINREIEQSHIDVLMNAFEGISKEDLIMRLTSVFCKKFLGSRDNTADLNVYNDKMKTHHRVNTNKATGRLSINIGKVDGLDERKIVKFIKQRAEISDKLIKNVEVKNTFSFLTFRNKSIAPRVAKILQGDSHNGRKIKIEFLSIKKSNYNK